LKKIARIEAASLHWQAISFAATQLRPTEADGLPFQNFWVPM